MGLFDIAESSWWSRVLYSLMRLDASYPNSTSITVEEVGLLGVFAVAAVVYSILALKWVLCTVQHLLKGRVVKAAVSSLPLVISAVVLAYCMEQINSRCGAIVVDPPPISEVPTYVGEITPSVFLEKYRGQVVKASGLKYDRSLWQPATLAEAFASSTAAMQMGNVEQEDAAYAVFKLAEFFRNMENETWVKSVTTEKGGVPYLAEENNILRHGGDKYMDAVEDMFSQSLVPLNSTHFHFTDVWLWAGPAGSRTGLHTDWDPTNLLHQLHGTKSVWVFPPNQTSRCYPSDKYDLGATIAHVNPFDPDYEKYPLYKEAIRFKVTVEPGDVLQIPAGWMHYAQCETSCVSLSGRSFSFAETMAVLPGVAGAVLHRFGLVGGEQSTSGYIISEGAAAESPSVWARLSNISWYEPEEEYKQ